jgi:pimeloyl-ACP methyl ester carboxylesterase
VRHVLAPARAVPVLRVRGDERDIAGRDVVTVVVGEEDAITPLEMSQTMSDAIPGATLSIIPGAGHISNLEAPTAFETALRAWLRRTG